MSSGFHAICVVLVITLGGILATPNSGPRSDLGWFSHASLPTPVGSPGTELRQATSSGSVATILGWINFTEGGGTVGTIDTVENVLAIVQVPQTSNGQVWDLGRGTIHNSTGVTNFTSSSDPDFESIATFLTDGLDWVVRSETIMHPSQGSLSASDHESNLLPDNPDLIGHHIELIRLNITFLNFTASGGETNFLENISWELWGHPVPVFFVPPTEPDGAHLIDRNHTVVRVRLIGAHSPVLEWNGRNQSLLQGASDWFANFVDLPNGAYSYRVWATTTTGTPTATPQRHLAVAVGVWKTEHVGTNGFYPSIAVNETGYPRICYVDTVVMYAERQQFGWSDVPVPSSSHCSLALDRTGEPHIGSAYAGLVYAYRSHGNWSVVQVDSLGPIYSSIALSPTTDEPMISYAYYESGLKLAVASEGGWTTQVVDSSFYGESTSLAIDLSGTPAIAYADVVTGTLKVAMWTGNAWAMSVVDTGVVAASIEFDPSGVVHVAYASQALAYATWDGSAWTIEGVDSGRYFSVALEFDSFGRPYIAYSMLYEGEVREAVKDGDWKIQVVSKEHGNGGVSLAIMPQGSAAIAFSQSGMDQSTLMATDFVDVTVPRSHVLIQGVQGPAEPFVSKVTVRLEAEDEWSGVGSIEYRLNGGPWLEYTGPFSVSADGSHVLDYRAIDGAGNVEPHNTIGFQIDQNPFSFSGPYRGLPTIYLLSLSSTIAAVVLWLIYRKRRKARPPA